MSRSISPLDSSKDGTAFEPGHLQVDHIEHARPAEHAHELEPQRILSGSTQVPYAEHGIFIDRSQTAELITGRGSGSQLLWPRIRTFCREPFAEFMGVFIIIMFGYDGHQRKH